MTHAQAPIKEGRMLGRQAKIVSPATLQRMLAYSTRLSHGHRRIYALFITTADVRNRFFIQN